MTTYQAPHQHLIHPGKKIPDQAVTGSGQGALLEELSREGDQTIVIQLEASVPSPGWFELTENDLFIGIRAIATVCPCRRFGWLPESGQTPIPEQGKAS